MPLVPDSYLRLKEWSLSRSDVPRMVVGRAIAVLKAPTADEQVALEAGALPPQGRIENISTTLRTPPALCENDVRNFLFWMNHRRWRELSDGPTPVAGRIMNL